MRAPDTATRPPAVNSAHPVRRVAERVESALSFVVARPLAALTVLAAVQWLAILGFALTVRHNGWLFYQGGDQIWLTTTGWLLGQGELPPTEVGYGWPLLLAPLTAIIGPNFVDAMPWVIVFNVGVLGPLLLWAIWQLASRIAGSAFGLIAVATWVLMPFAAIPLWRDDYHERYVEQFLPGALGLTALADYQSMVMLLVGAVFFERALRQQSTPDGVAAGLIVAFAIGTKPSNGLFIAAPIAAAIVARRLRPLLPFALALLPALVTLAIWKQRGFGSLPVFAAEEAHVAIGMTAAVPSLDQYIDLDWGNLHDNLNNLREFFWSARLLQFAPVAGAVAVARRSPSIAALLSIWFATFLIVKGTTPLSTVSSGSFFRFLMPAFPAYFLLVVSTLLLLPTAANRMAAKWPAPTPPRLSVPIVAALVGATVVIPLAMVSLVRPIETADDAIAVNTILTPVDDRIAVSVRRDGEERTLSWTHPAAGSSDVFYRVYRTGAHGLEQECLEHGGAKECSLEMILLGTTRERRWRDGSPPPGVRYRVGVAANSRNDAAAGDVATLSPPVAG
jgi:hypothetical protein